MSEHNKSVVRRLFDEVWNAGNLPAIDECLAREYVHHDSSTPDYARGPEGEKRRVSLYRTAFPDLRLKIEDIVEDGDTIVARWTARGTHKGDLGGVSPTGKPVVLSGMTIARFSGGKIAEGWVNWDARGMYEQLGIARELSAV